MVRQFVSRVAKYETSTNLFENVHYDSWSLITLKDVLYSKPCSNLLGLTVAIYGCRASNAKCAIFHALLYRTSLIWQIYRTILIYPSLHHISHHGCMLPLVKMNAIFTTNFEPLRLNCVPYRGYSTLQKHYESL